MSACDRSGDAVETPTYYNYKGVKGEGNLRAIDFSDTMNGFIDVKSIRREGDLAIVWTVDNFRGSLLDQMKANQNASSVKSLETFNCREKTFNSTDYITFSEPWLGGVEVSRGVLTNGVTAVLKDSVAEVKMIILCKYPQTPVPISATPIEQKLADGAPSEQIPAPASAPEAAPAPAPAPALNSSGSSSATAQNDAFRMMVARAVNELGPNGYAKCANATITMVAMRVRGDNLGRLAPNVDPMINFMAAVRVSLMSKGNPESLLDKLMKNADQIMMAKNDPVLAAMQDFDKCYIDAIR